VLTKQQQALLQIARSYGHVTIDQARLVYSSRMARITALKRLVALNYLRPSVVPNRFDFVGGKK